MEQQAPLDLDLQAAEACDRSGFELGWDHAHHGLVPPPGLLLDGTPVGQGWRAGKAVFGRRTLAATRPVRQWLALRTEAWRRGIAFETQQVSAHYLGQIEASHCPVTRRPLGGAAGSADAAVVTRLNGDAGYGAGNLAAVSTCAAAVMEGIDAAQALWQAARLDAGIEAAPEGFAIDAVWRLAVLKSFATPLPFAEAARIPLRVLPPNRVRQLNAVQGLQTLVTLLFATPGWSARVREFADLLLPFDIGRELRRDFNLFVGAFAARLPAAGADGRETRRALEDAWACERVARRWQAFALAAGEAAVERLLERAAQAGLAGVRMLMHEAAQATEGWSLASRGRVVARPRRGVQVVAAARGLLEARG